MCIRDSDIFEGPHVFGAEEGAASERVDLATRGELDAGGGGAGAEGDAGPLARGGCEVGIVEGGAEDGADPRHHLGAAHRALADDDG